jgi:hypothetical protein
MSDGNPLFSAAHGNLAAAGGAIADATLTAARLALRMMTNQNGQPLSVEPKYLLAPATQETTAQKGLAAIYPTQNELCECLRGFRAAGGGCASRSSGPDAELVSVR